MYFSENMKGWQWLYKDDIYSIVLTLCGAEFIWNLSQLFTMLFITENIRVCVCVCVCVCVGSKMSNL